MDALKLSAVSYDLLDYIKIHKRLAAEKIDLKIAPLSRISDQKIKRFPSDLSAHKRAPSVIFPFLRKAVFTGKIAVVRYVQTHGLYDIVLSLLFRKLFNERLINIPGKKLLGIFKRLYFVIRL